MPGESTVSFKCGSCGKSYRAPAKMAGKGVRCKKCGEPMRVPGPGDGAGDEDVFSIDELAKLSDEPSEPGRGSAGESDEVFSIEDLQALGDAPPAAPATRHTDSGSKPKPKPKPNQPVKPRKPAAGGDDDFIGFKDEEDDAPLAMDPVAKPKPKPPASTPKPARSAARESGASRPSVPKPGRSMPEKPSRPAPAAKPEEVFAIDDLMSPDEVGPVQHEEPLAWLPSPAAPMAGAGIESGQTNRGGSGKGSSGSGGWVPDFAGMWQAFITPPAGTGQVPMVRRVSMGGVFLVVGGVLLSMFSLTFAPRDEIDRARAVMKESIFERVEPLQETGSLIGIGFFAVLAGLLMLGRRVWMPRRDKEAPLVLVVFWGTLGIVLICSAIALFAGTEHAANLSKVGGLGIMLSAAAFGLWLMYRLNEDMDGTSLLLLLAPAVIMPLTFIIYLLSNVPTEHWGDLNWGRILLTMFLMFLTLALAGGAISFIVLLMVPLILLGVYHSEQLPEIKFDALSVVGFFCFLCYLLLILTRWKVMFKPVAWQFVIILVGGLLMISFMQMDFENKLLADTQAKTGQVEDALTQEMRALGKCPPGVTASYEPFPNSPQVNIQGARQEVVYLSNGGILMNPRAGATPSSPSFGQGGHGDTARRDRTPKPIFTPGELPAGRETPPTAAAAWQGYGLPDVSFAQSTAVDWSGYHIPLLPGYRVTTVEDQTRDGGRKLVISAPGAERPPVAIELHLTPQIVSQAGTIADQPWEQMIQQHAVSSRERFIDYGKIGAMRFARSAPSEQRRDRHSEMIVYVSQMPESLYRLSILIPTGDKSEGQLLACEAMVRSIRRGEPKIDPAFPAKDGLHSSLTAYREATIESTRWRITGIFAAPQSNPSLYGRLTDDPSSGLSLAFTLSGTRAGIEIAMQPAEEGRARDIRIQADGPELLQKQGDGFDGTTLYAFGGKVGFEKLWDDAVFARIERGIGKTEFGSMNQELYYYGWLGGYWTTIRLYRRASDKVSMAELESRMRSMRLANPLELYDNRVAARAWLTRMLREGAADLPLAGGVMVAEAFELDPLGQPVLSKHIDPEHGTLVQLYPELDPALLEGFEQWEPKDEYEKYLGETETVGPITIRTLSDLKRSSRSTPTQVKWFANTDAGKLGLTVMIDRVGKDEEVIKVPVSQDPDTGETEIRIGRRTLREDGEIGVSYRESRGLRVWRVLMPQVAGAKVRRCYYVTEMPGHRVTISADFERGSADQLRAFDLMVSTMLYHPPEEIR